MSTVVELRSGGQSGADRGAMDTARRLGIPLSGWCPAGGWAEDCPNPPGVLALYPEMQETPSADVIQRTEWNIRDSTCCIVLDAGAEGVSPGTDAGFKFYEKYGVPFFRIELDGPDALDDQVEHACGWLRSLNDDAIVLGIGGPRASEYPGIYDITSRVVERILYALS